VLLNKLLIIPVITALTFPLPAQPPGTPAPAPAKEPAIQAPAATAVTPAPSPAVQQPGTPAPAAAKEKPGKLKIVVLEGEGAKNDIKAGVGVAPRVQVLDEAGKPVPNAEVVFQLPMTGASAVFNGWVRTQTVRTDEDGQAAATGYQPNDVPGRFNIKVTATAGNSKGTAIIAQSNVNARATRASKKKWWILGAVAAGAGVALGVAAARDTTSSSSPSSPVVITSGPVTVGSPK